MKRFLYPFVWALAAVMLFATPLAANDKPWVKHPGDIILFAAWCYTLDTMTTLIDTYNEKGNAAGVKLWAEYDEAGLCAYAPQAYRGIAVAKHGSMKSIDGDPPFDAWEVKTERTDTKTPHLFIIVQAGPDPDDPQPEPPSPKPLPMSGRDA